MSAYHKAKSGMMIALIMFSLAIFAIYFASIALSFMFAGLTYYSAYHACVAMSEQVAITIKFIEEVEESKR